MSMIRTPKISQLMDLVKIFWASYLYIINI